MTESMKANLLASVVCIIAAVILYFSIAGGGIDKSLAFTEQMLDKSLSADDRKRVIENLNMEAVK
jgi:uncharacterized protein YybS (DUF2232 family)